MLISVTQCQGEIKVLILRWLVVHVTNSITRCEYIE
jgi:hypothetical protein